LPHLVEMQKKYGEQGLVIVTVSVDPPDKAEQIADANRILRKLNAPFTHLHLNESAEVWEKRLDFSIPPAYFIFDRQGRWKRLLGADYDEKEIHEVKEKIIREMLNEK
jgi:peroxiredoxin